jgi:RHH-type proline utilization regulon transcriptional repressor/proline dehydrogenase/delta 1-pyrroline-5-carboxylate dehydrogenase
VPLDTDALDRAWSDVFSREHDPTGLTVEANVLRYRPLPRGVALHGATPEEVAYAWHASRLTGTRLVVMHDEVPPAEIDRLRVPRGASESLLRAAHEAGVVVDDQPITGNPHVELLRWLREQAISRTLHRFGNVL